MNKEELIIYAIRTSEAIKEEKKQELIDYASNLQQKNQKYKEVIDKLKKYIRLTVSEEEFIETEHYVELLDILKEVSE